MKSYLYFPNVRTLVFVILAIFIADQAVKFWMLEVVGIATRPPIILTPFFKLVMVWNHGVSFGMLSLPGTAMVWVLIAVAIGISAMLWHMASRSDNRIEQLCFAVIIGGALGNVVDRLRFGAVADFFYFHYEGLAWPAFNIADAAIFLGVARLLWHMLRCRKRA